MLGRKLVSLAPSRDWSVRATWFGKRPALRAEWVQADVRDTEAVARGDGRRRRRRPHRLPPGRRCVVDERRRLRGRRARRGRRTARPPLQRHRLRRHARPLQRGGHAVAGQRLRPLEGRGRAAGRRRAPRRNDRAHVADLRRAGRAAGTAGPRREALLCRRVPLARARRGPGAGCARGARSRVSGTAAHRRLRRHQPLRLRRAARRRRRSASNARRRRPTVRPT